jgi:FHS family L-fucose permease-like MFS transporter
MAASGDSTGGTVARSAPRYGPALALLATLFFMWGFITVINDSLLPHLKSVFQLNYLQTMLIQFAWFIGYFVASIPSALLIERIGYHKALVVGLAVMTIGSLGMIPAALLPSYWVTLASLFIVSCGIALLQVAANAYVAVIGPAETAESRLTFVQAFNTSGDFLAVLFGQQLILARTVSGTTLQSAHLTLAQRMADARATQLPYLIVAAVLAVLAIVIWRARLPELGTATRRVAAEQRRHLSLLRHRNLVCGVFAIFVYLIAEIGVGSLFISFASRPDIGNVTHEEAANYLMFVWGGMALGRFGGAFIMRAIAPEKVLAAFAIGAFVVMMIASTAHGPTAMYGLMAVGLFHSIMFPTIFALAIRGLGPLTEEGSGWLIWAIAGGALVIVQGKVADQFGIQHSFLITAACELFVLFYALWGSRPTHALPPEPVEARGS